MKKHYYLYAIVLLAIIAVLPAIVRAEEGASDTTVDSSTSANVDTRLKTPLPIPKPGMSNPAALREQLRVNGENARKELELKNKKLLENKIASSTKPKILEVRKDIRDDRREDVSDILKETRENIREASSTMERREIRKDMRLDIFKVRKEAIIKQHNIFLHKF